MPKRSRRPKATRATPSRSKAKRPSGRSGSPRSTRGQREPSLIDNIAAALGAPDPLPLLSIASSLLSVLEDRSPLAGRDQPAQPSRDDVLKSFFEVALPETSALLAAVAGLSDDDVLKHRVRREIAARAHVLPRWLLAMDQAEAVDGVFEMGHAL